MGPGMDPRAQLMALQNMRRGGAPQPMQAQQAAGVYTPQPAAPAPQGAMGAYQAYQGQQQDQQAQPNQALMGASQGQPRPRPRRPMGGGY